MTKTCIALIPAFDPEPLLLPLLASIQRAGLYTVLVNDGSDPSFNRLFEQAKSFADVLTHEKNRGKGRALKTGLDYIQTVFGKNCIIVTMDADGQHKIADAKKLCEAVLRHPNTLILGSRKFKENVPLRSQFGNTITRLVYRLSTGLSVHDTQTGLRAFSGELLPELIAIPGERYEYEMNVLLECAKRNIPMKELEIETIYFDNNIGSHFNTIKDSYLIYKEILKFSASSLIGFMVDYCVYSILLLLTVRLNIDYSLWISNIGARLVSGSVNYTLNRRFVFQDDGDIKKTFLSYVFLASIILLGNTILLSLLVELGISPLFAKICTEISFFLFSWIFQRTIIFSKRKYKKK
ncbi:MAG: GtrA family protein [Lachnospiraceae bacterium]